jgi:hypothetical protein
LAIASKILSVSEVAVLAVASAAQP